MEGAKSQFADVAGNQLVETVLANVAKLRAGSEELQQLPCTIEVQQALVYKLCVNTFDIVIDSRYGYSWTCKFIPLCSIHLVF